MGRVLREGNADDIDLVRKYPSISHIVDLWDVGAYGSRVLTYEIRLDHWS